MDPTTLLVGFLAGAGATVPMTATEVPAYRRWGLEAVLEWHENQTVLGRLLRRPPESLVLPGLLLHVLHGGVAGVVFLAGLALLNLRPAAPLLGPLFGLLLWSVTLLIHRPLTGVPPVAHPQGRLPLLLSLLGHMVYGLALGFLGGGL